MLSPFDLLFSPFISSSFFNAVPFFWLSTKHRSKRPGLLSCVLTDRQLFEPNDSGIYYFSHANKIKSCFFKKYYMQFKRSALHQLPSENRHLCNQHTNWTRSDDWIRDPLFASTVKRVFPRSTVDGQTQARESFRPSKGITSKQNGKQQNFGKNLGVWQPIKVWL